MKKREVRFSLCRIARLLKKLPAHWCDDNTFSIQPTFSYLILSHTFSYLILSHTFSCFLILSQFLTYFLIPILIFNTFSTSTSDILSHTNPISILSHFFMLRQHRNIVRSKKT
jgi:hypothetical protein